MQLQTQPVSSSEWKTNKTEKKVLQNALQNTKFTNTNVISFTTIRKLQLSLP